MRSNLNRGMFAIGCVLIAHISAFADPQASQQSVTAQELESATEVPQNKADLTSLELSKQSIDELFQSNNAKNSKNRFTTDSRSEAGELLITKDSKLGEKIARAARIDCRDKYVSPTPNLLLIIPLLFETVTGTGCKW